MKNQIIINDGNSSTPVIHKFTHYSSIYKGSKKLFNGNNNDRNVFNGRCICFSTHAEIDVLVKLLKLAKIKPFKGYIDLSSYTIVVIRLGSDGTFKNSRPCSHCVNVLKFYNIKKVVYSSEDGLLITEKIKTMDSMHVSSGWNAYYRFNKVHHPI
jgi:tRNA(Arg) A34 adenosine deaminase TadA